MPYTSLVLENQFGEVSNNFIKGGSSQLRAKFTVARSDSAGKGITGLSASGISAVYMHTSATPSANNPNPADGYIQVEFEKGFDSFQALASSVRVPNSGSDLLVASAGLTVGTVYVISVLGNTSAAQWLALGVPAGITAAVGVAFVAAATSATGTGAVQVPKTGGAAVAAIQVVGDPSVGVKADDAGAVVLLACYKPGGTITGSALGNHSHDLLIKGGQAAASTAALAWYATDILGKEAATDKTIAGADSATKGGVIAASAGTPAATLAGANVVGQPADGTEIELCFSVYPSAAPLI